jgi:hypothetical protein
MGHGKACLSAVLASVFASAAFLRATEPIAEVFHDQSAHEAVTLTCLQRADHNSLEDLELVMAVGVSSGHQAPSTDPAATTLTRLRGTDAALRATIEEGCHRSPLFAELVQHVERSSYIVYVEQVPALRNGMSGVLLHGGAGPRYLRVLLKRGMSLDRRVVVLAHELQHACEVLEAAIPANAVEMDALFRKIGDERRFGGEQQQYETTAAIRVADTVAADLRAKHPARRSALSCRAGAKLRLTSSREGRPGSASLAAASFAPLRGADIFYGSGKLASSVMT